MPLLPTRSRLTFCFCAKLPTVPSQPDPSRVDSGRRQGRFGLKWVFSLEHVAHLHQETHVFLLDQGEHGQVGSVSSRAANELLMLLGSYVSWNFYT